MPGGTDSSGSKDAKPRKQPPRLSLDPPDPEAEPKDVRGARCPVCDALDYRTDRTEHISYRKTVRVRVCQRCRHRWSVTETSGSYVKSTDEAIDLEFKLNRLVEQAKRARAR